MLRRPQVLILTLLLASRATAQSAPRFTLTSSDVQPGRMIGAAQVFNGMGCTGSNKSPALQWRGAPAATKSFALTIYDPDAPTGSGWWHWVVYDIPATATGLPGGAANGPELPVGARQGNTDFGTPTYGGPCPPAGDKPHHYIFTLYALNVDKLGVPATATAANVGFNIHAHVIGKATFTAIYKH